MVGTGCIEVKSVCWIQGSPVARYLDTKSCRRGGIGGLVFLPCLFNGLQVVLGRVQKRNLHALRAEMNLSTRTSPNASLPVLVLSFVISVTLAVRVAVDFNVRKPAVANFQLLPLKDNLSQQIQVPG